jgi:hypothetical protein
MAVSCERQAVTSSKLADVKPKEKCCRSKPRCQRPPQAELNGLRGKKMDKAYERAGKIRWGAQTHSVEMSHVARQHLSRSRLVLRSPVVR